MKKIFQTDKGEINLLEKDGIVEISIDDGSYIKISDVKVPLFVFENEIEKHIENIKKKLGKNIAERVFKSLLHFYREIRDEEHFGKVEILTVIKLEEYIILASRKNGEKVELSMEELKKEIAEKNNEIEYLEIEDNCYPITKELLNLFISAKCSGKYRNRYEKFVLILEEIEGNIVVEEIKYRNAALGEDGSKSYFDWSSQLFEIPYMDYWLWEDYEKISKFLKLFENNIKLNVTEDKVEIRTKNCLVIITSDYKIFLERGKIRTVILKGFDRELELIEGKKFPLGIHFNFRIRRSSINLEYYLGEWIFSPSASCQGVEYLEDENKFPNFLSKFKKITAENIEELGKFVIKVEKYFLKEDVEKFKKMANAFREKWNEEHPCEKIEEEKIN